jgi:spore coat protein U-like protein
MSTGANLTVRRITNPGSAFLSYALFPNSAGTINASPSADADPVAQAGNGRAQGSASGELSAKRSVTPPAYVDTMIVTVIY